MTSLSRKLRRLLQRAASRSLSSLRIPSFLSSSSRSSSLSSHYDLDDFDHDDDEVEDNLVDIPRGCFAVYVGCDRQRFVVGTRFLTNPLFMRLLDKAADEYGLDQQGALLIPCEAVLFDHICWLLGNNDPSASSLEMEELIDFYSS